MIPLADSHFDGDGCEQFPGGCRGVCQNCGRPGLAWEQCEHCGRVVTPGRTAGHVPLAVTAG
jgi:hypothetical protein